MEVIIDHMRFPRAYTLIELSKFLGCDFVGQKDFPILGINEIHRVQNGELVFVDHPKYYDKALNSDASVILIDQNREVPEGKTLLISDDPYRDFNRLTDYFKPFRASSKLISESASIGKGTIIQPNVFIGCNVEIGKNCIIHPNVSIHNNVYIGDRVIIQSGTVIGSDAFYYKKRSDVYDRLFSGGTVVVEDQVEIGANCTIDRGVSDSTIIGKGSKLDNLVQIGHDTIIGKNCLIASQVGIAGCCIIENEVTIWGQVGITSGVTIGKKAILSAKSGIGKSLAGSKTYAGAPAQDILTVRRKMVALDKLPSILKKQRINTHYECTH